jgi:hypothetical protein
MEDVMSEAVHNVEHEYWRPPAQPTHAVEAPPTMRGQLTCAQCGTEFIMGSRFCHVCGSERESLVSSGTAHRWAQILDFTRIREGLGLSLGSLIAFIAGIGCILAAIGLGFMFTAATFQDWQAVQIWRIEWLLAGAAAFLAGILLKKADAR